MRRQGASAPSVLHGFVLPARLLFFPQIRDFPHEVLQTEEKCAFD